MDINHIIYIIIVLVIIVIFLFYFWYIKTDKEEKEDIPYNLLYERDSTVVDLLRNISEKYGKYPALLSKKKDKWETINYAKYYKLSKTFAEKLLYFIGPHPRIAILSFNRPEWFYSHMGTMISGGVSVGIYPTASASNCGYITNHSHIDILIIEDLKQLTKFSDIKIPTVKYILILEKEGIDINNSDIIESVKNNNPDIIIDSFDSFINQSIGSETINTTIDIGKPYPEDIATIIYTSGTTGDPKGVVITHKNILSSIRAGLNAIQSRSNINICIQESYISYLPLNHVAAQMMDIYVPLASVGKVYFADKDAMKGSLKDTIKEIKPTIFIGVPRVWEKIYDKIKEKQADPQGLLNKMFINKMILQEIGLDKAKYCISAAAPINKEIKVFFNNLGLELCDVYGMSETTGPISMGVPGCSHGAGVPVMNVKIDKDSGEILVKGDLVFKEYYKNKKATQEAFTDKGWFKTGDIGYIDRDGSLYVTGRIKDLIITAGGENISPMPIEEELLTNLNKNKKYFDYVVVIGDKKKFLSVLLVPTKNYSEKKISDSEINLAIDQTNAKAPNSTSTIKKFIVLKDQTFEIGECLTPTLKIRRNNIMEKYKALIDNLYNGSD